MSLSLLSHAAQIFGQGVPVSPFINALLMTLVGLVATASWASDIHQ